MALLLGQVVRIAPRVTGFTVVCQACAEEARDGYAPGASVSGTLSLDRRQGTVECRRGHAIDVEREPRR